MSWEESEQKKRLVLCSLTLTPDSQHRSIKLFTANQLLDFSFLKNEGTFKELTCTTHGHELRRGNSGGRGGAERRGIKEKKSGTTVIA